MKNILFLTLLITINANAQELIDYNHQRLKMDEKLMLTLGSWSTVNLIGSGIGWGISQKGEASYFHQMNVMWNTVNLGLAIPGYIKARKTDPSMSLRKIIDEQYKTEKIFLFNAGLDITYMTSGFLLRNEAKINPNRRDQFNGYGNSLIVQGAFLFVFDVAAHVIHVSHRKRGLNPMIDRLSLSSNGIGLIYSLDSRESFRR